MSKKIGILCECVYQFCGNVDLKGGGERYFVDFVNLLHKLGYKTIVYQFSYKPFRKKYQNIIVNGLGNITTKNPNQYYNDGLNMFEEKTKDCDGLFYLSMNLLMRAAKKPTLTVSHGLVFDGVLPNQRQHSIEALDTFKTWIRNSTHTISVDTNSIKVMQVHYCKNISKMTFIPNYVDLNIFKPSERINDGKFNILFPRRKQFCRGYHTMMAATQILMNKYDDINVTFCGKGNKEEEDFFKQWYEKMPKNRIKNISYDMKDMWKAYQNIDISCIPTIYAEGTSLSCLESQASGIVPIATHVGGLTDLILKNFNGLLIKPDDTWQEYESNPNYLLEAIEYLYHNRDELKRMKKNAIEVSKSFSKEIWDNRIAKVIKQVYGESN